MSEKQPSQAHDRDTQGAGDDQTDEAIDIIAGGATGGLAGGAAGNTGGGLASSGSSSDWSVADDDDVAGMEDEGRDDARR